jgi:hypothetical protein
MNRLLRFLDRIPCLGGFHEGEVLVFCGREVVDCDHCDRLVLR